MAFSYSLCVLYLQWDAAGGMGGMPWAGCRGRDAMRGAEPVSTLNSLEDATTNAAHFGYIE